MPVLMPRATAANIDQFSRAKDPKKAIMDAVASALPSIQVMYHRVLLAIYIRPERTSGGIIRPQGNVQEDVWQGKVGLVIKLGDFAFQEAQFYQQRFEVGDWAACKTGDSWPMLVNDVPCRLAEDAALVMKLDDPTMVL